MRDLPCGVICDLMRTFDTETHLTYVLSFLDLFLQILVGQEKWQQGWQVTLSSVINFLTHILAILTVLTVYMFLVPNRLWCLVDTLKNAS